MRPLLTLLIAALMTTPSPAADLPAPPDVAKKPHVVKAPHGAERRDEYYWLRDDSRKNPEMLAYLNAENAYADAFMARLKPVEDRLYDEIVGRIRQDDSSVPYRDRGWWYYSRFEAGKDYPVHARRRDGAGMDAMAIQRANDRGDFGDEAVLLDVNALASGREYYSVGTYEVSPDNRLLAYADDTVGRRQYVIRFRDLETGKVFADEIPGRLGRRRLGRRQPHRLLHRERSRDAADQAGEEARARHAGGAGPGGVRGEGRQLLHGRSTARATSASSASR